MTSDEFRAELKLLAVRQRHLATRLGLSEHTVNGWAKGRYAVPRYAIAYLELLRYARSIEDEHGISR